MNRITSWYSRAQIALPLDEVKREYCELKMSMAEIAKARGIALSTVRRRLVKLGVIRAKDEAMQLAKPKMSLAHTGKPRHFSEEHLTKFRTCWKFRKNVISPKAVRINTNGYYEFTGGEKMGKLVHRDVIEKHLGRKLASDEIVHHRDHNKLNNSIENLQLMTASEHAAYHRAYEKKAREQ